MNSPRQKLTGAVFVSQRLRRMAVKMTHARLQKECRIYRIAKYPEMSGYKLSQRME